MPDRSGRASDPAPVPVDIADEVQLARIALAADDDDLAKLALTNAQQRAARNPGIPSISAVASHVRGLLAGDEADLGDAVALFAKGPRRLEHAAALEDLGVSLGRSDRAGQIDALQPSTDRLHGSGSDLGRAPRPQPTCGHSACGGGS